MSKTVRRAPWVGAYRMTGTELQALARIYNYWVQERGWETVHSVERPDKDDLCRFDVLVSRRVGEKVETYLYPVELFGLTPRVGAPK